MSNFVKVVTPQSIMVVTNGTTHNASRSHINFEQIKQALAEGRNDDALALFDVAKGINDFGQGQVHVSNGVVMFGTTPIHNSLTKRILDMVRMGESVDHLVNFLTNLLGNPSNRAVNELFGFLEGNNLPITDDGCFIAYKAVTNDYKDKHSRTWNYGIGTVAEMPRNAVDEDKERTCSYGLHFASWGYAKSFGSFNRDYGSDDRMLLLKINPRDVVAIPIDYANQKGRTCRFEVISEITDVSSDPFAHDDAAPVFHQSTVYGSDAPVTTVGGTNVLDDDGDI